MAKIEFYIGADERHIAVADDGAVPRAGEIINIRGEHYEVTRVVWCVDHADVIFETKIRACVEIKPIQREKSR